MSIQSRYFLIIHQFLRKFYQNFVNIRYKQMHDIARFNLILILVKNVFSIHVNEGRKIQKGH